MSRVQNHIQINSTQTIKLLAVAVAAINDALLNEITSGTLSLITVSMLELKSRKSSQSRTESQVLIKEKQISIANQKKIVP
jgi:hypothetical protein